MTVLVAGLAGCTSGSTPSASGTPAQGSTSSAAAPGPELKADPADGATDVNPTAPITVSASAGTVSTATLTSPDGAVVTGNLSTNQSTWTTATPLGYGKKYTLTATAQNAEGKTATLTSSFTTLAPANLTLPYLQTTGGQSLDNGATYGVGIVPVVHFDEKVTDKAAAEKALVVTTVPAISGSWFWTDAQNAHYRPNVAAGSYWPSGTQVTLSANVYGKDLGSGLYGQSDVSTSFVIGAKHVSVADDNTHQVSVYFDDVLQRTMPTSMGKGGYTTGSSGQKISFFTPSGTYTVIAKLESTVMDSSSYGLPVDAPGGYKETIPWATRISTDGIYLHELDSTVSAQGRYDTSHGCLNLNKANAVWFQQNALIGDVVQVVNTGGAPLELWQNGDWTLSWDQWTAGSAL